MKTRAVGALLWSLTVPSCGTVSGWMPTNPPPHPMQPKPPEQVELFTTAKPTREFVEVGIVEAAPSSGYSSAGDFQTLQQLRVEGGQRGCDGLVVIGEIKAANGSNSRAWGFQVLVRDQNGRFDARWHHDKVLPRGVYTGRTAEVITEWPAGYAYGSWVLGSSGLVNTGAVQYDHEDYTSTVKGDPKQEAFPVPGAPVILTHNGRVAIYPSAPYQAADSAMPDAFTTRYGPNWWK